MFAVIGLLCCSADLQAIEIESVKAQRTGDRYQVDFTMTVAIPESFAREILEDPDRVVEVNEELQSVTHLSSNKPGMRRFRDRTSACIWLFCVDYENTLNMQILDNNDIRLVIEPALSEFKYGVFTWRTKPLGPDRTRILFHSVSTPGFWVPSTAMLQKRMKKGIYKMLAHMECEYRQDLVCKETAWEDSTAE